MGLLDLLKIYAVTVMILKVDEVDVVAVVVALSVAFLVLVSRGPARTSDEDGHEIAIKCSFFVEKMFWGRRAPPRSNY